MDSLLVTLLPSTRASSLINHSSATFLFPKSATASSSSSSNSFPQYLSHPTSFFIHCNSPRCLFLTDCFSSALHIAGSFALSNPVFLNGQAMRAWHKPGWDAISRASCPWAGPAAFWLVAAWPFLAARWLFLLAGLQCFFWRPGSFSWWPLCRLSFSSQADPAGP